MSNLMRRFPYLIALGACGLYALAISHGVTVNSLPLTAKVAGWDDTPLVGHPLFWLLTLPVRLLPAGWISVALNLFAAATAAVTLGLLARTVQLLPWDRAWSQDKRWAAALPMLLACVVCGLEFNFWREATAATGEMLELLLLATAVWLMLEFRVRREARWLNAAAFVWGLGMAENWMMLLTLPLFIAGVIWLKKFSFFQKGFLLRMAGLGLAGFAIYALLPLVNGLNPHSPWSLGEAWLASFQQTKNVGLLLYFKFWRPHRLLTLVVGLYFLLPMLACLLWQRDEGTQSKFGVDRFQVWIFRGLRALLLLVCLWLAFDPLAGPRQMVQHQFGIAMPLLTFDYLNALGAAFLAGSLLLIAQEALQQPRRSRPQFQWWRLALPGLVGILGLLSLALVVKSAMAVLRVNFFPLQRFGELAADSLPPGRGVMLSDYRQRLTVFQAAMSHRPNRKDWLAVDTRALAAVAYREWLERQQPMGWLTDETRHELTPGEMLRLLDRVARTNRLFYLHPSYGYFFERFYLAPAGTVYEMKLRGSQPLDLPPLPPAMTDANEARWTAVWPKELAPLCPVPRARPSGWQKKIKLLGFSAPPRYQDPLLAEWYSFALDAWGVALQRQGRWPEARLRLEQAGRLNTNNLAARASLICNSNLVAGLSQNLANTSLIATWLEKPDFLMRIINNCGPFDDPVFCYLQGNVFQKTGLFFQAVAEYERVRELAPGALAPELALAELYTRLRFPERARPIISHIRTATQEVIRTNSAIDLNLALLEVNTWLAQTNPALARAALQAVLDRHPHEPQLATQVMTAYASFGDYSNALQLADAQLTRLPDDLIGLNNQAVLLIQSGQVTNALPILDRVLTLTNLPAARLNRAMARLSIQDIAGAETDYLELEQNDPQNGQISCGLAAIAMHRKDTNQALHYLRLCLTNSPPGTAFWREANKYLKSLEASPTAN